MKHSYKNAKPDIAITHKRCPAKQNLNSPGKAIYGAKPHWTGLYPDKHGNRKYQELLIIPD